MRDKQNVNAATRILDPNIRCVLKAHDEERTLGTRIFLEIGEHVKNAFMETNLSICERVKSAWNPDVFLK